jgi:poly-gamma-glutamate synthesis protein (capsule biosynthesis protein)
MDSVTVMLAGDVMTGRGIDQVMQQPSVPVLFEAHARDARDYVALAERVNGPIPRAVANDYPWGDALAELQRVAPQLRIVNLETSITTSDDAWPDKGIHYRMHPASVSFLTAAAIDCCALANNHVLDWGRKGLEQTLHTLHAAGVRTAGAGVDADAAWRPAVLPIGGDRRALVFSCATASSGVFDDWAAAPRRSGVALLPDLSEATARRLADDVARHRRGDELVIVSIHWGANWVEQVPAQHRRFARALIDMQAADIVHGHSSHHPMPFERYRDRLILYGCGDLINDYEGIEPRGTMRSDVGCLYFVTLQPATGALQRLEVVLLQLCRFRLQHADAAARHWAMRCLGLDAAPAGESPSPSDWLVIR